MIMKKSASLFLVLLILSSANADLFENVLLGVGGAVAVGFGGPLVLGAIGFTSSGIAAGSCAASMMSAAAIANGGGVAAGGLVATGQALGAAGMGYAIPAAVGAAAAGIKAAFDD